MSKGHVLGHEGGFQLRTQTRFPERQRRMPLSIGESSQSSKKQFRARPIPKFCQGIVKPQIMLNDKKLTIANPFKFETDRRSL
jgi:hypothetical protein